MAKRKKAEGPVAAPPQPEATPAPSTSSIAERAMIVSLTIHRWEGRINDRKITEEVNKQRHQGNKKMGWYNKSLIDPEALDPIQRAASALYMHHRRNTLPWLDEGSRVLSSQLYFQYTLEQRKLEEDYLKAVEELMPKYPALKQDAKDRLNGDYHEEQYPSEDELRRKFGVTRKILPIADAKDFRVQLGEVETARVKAEMEQSLKTQFEDSVKDIWRRLQEVVSRMVERLNAYTVDSSGKVKNTFHDTLVTNIVDLLDLAPALNITNDTKLDQFCREIRDGLTVHSPDTLRDNEKVRKDTARRAEEIMGKMAAFL